MSESPEQQPGRLLLAVSLSVIILFGWHYFVQKPRLEQQAKARAEAEKSLLANSGDTLPLLSQKDKISLNQNSTQPKIQLSHSESLATAPRVRINNGKLHGSISLRGARFDDLTLAEYHEEAKPGSSEVILLSPAQSPSPYFAELNWLAADGTVVPNAETIWSADRDLLTEQTPVTLSWDNGQGLRFITVIALDDHYLFNITQRVENYGTSAKNLYPYGVVHRNYVEHVAPMMILHEGPVGVMSGVLEEESYADLKKNGTRSFENARGWLGISDKYWLTALVPDATQAVKVNFQYQNQNQQDRYQVDFLGTAQAIAPGESLSLRHRFFAGAKKVEVLDSYAERYNITLFDRAVDFGWLYFITKPIFHLLTNLYHLVGNFGVAILLLTVIVKLALFPLANKSYKSMDQMKRVQPELLKIRERLKDDKLALNKEMLALYQREKINPMAGCLPMLIQIPVFFALYKVLFVTIEMRHAPFFGWIYDLSAPDPTNIFTLFGLIPWHAPSFLHLGIWPILMGATMFLQQYMQPAPSDPIQAKVMRLLPFIFLFLFASFPAGLVVYWAWSNLLSILQQWWITKRADSSVAKKSKRTPKPDKKTKKKS